MSLLSLLPFSSLSPEQISIVQGRVDSSLIIEGGPSSGKTSTLLHIMLYLKHMDEREEKSFLFITTTSLFKRILDSELSDKSISCHTDTMSHFLKYPKQYDYIFIDDCHRYTLTGLEKVRQYGGKFYLACDFSHPLIDGSYLGNDRQSDMELPPAQGITELFGASIYCLHYTFLSFSNLIGILRGRQSYPLQFENNPFKCFVYKVDSVLEACRFISSFISSCNAEDVGILSYTRKGIQEADAIFQELGHCTNTFLPWVDGIDTFDLTKKHASLLTIKGSMGLHFRHVFILPHGGSLDWDSFEIAVSRANQTTTFFYETELMEPLSSHMDCFNNLTLPSAINNSSSDEAPISF